MKYFIANWKAHKDINEATSWVNEFNSLVEGTQAIQDKLTSGQYRVVICPPHALIYAVKKTIINIPTITVGAQDVSMYDEGSYTGETVAKSMQGLVTHTLLGHSERRYSLKETDEQIRFKFSLAKKYHIDPILCINSPHDEIIDGIALLAYEPITAIGTGDNMLASEVLKVRDSIRPIVPFLYGGSVNKTNVKEYFSQDGISGAVIGTATLNPKEFIELIAAA